MKRHAIFGLLSLFIFFLAAVYITYPLIFHLTDHVTGVGGLGDIFIIAWIQNWVLHALSTQPLSLFNATIFHPYQYTLAFSEPFITSAILAFPLRIITGEPISTVNVTLISSLSFFGFSMYALSYYLTKDFFLSVVIGLLVMFSPAVLEYSVHLHILALGCVPFALMFFLEFIRTHRSLYLAISLLFLLLQIYNSIMPGYFIIFSYVIIYVFNLWQKKKQSLRLINRINISLFVIAAVLVIPLAVPYFSVSKQFSYVRDIRDAIHFAMQPEDLLYPSWSSRFHDVLIHVIPTNQYSQNDEFKAGYLGIVFSILAVGAMYRCIKYFRKNTLTQKSFFAISLTGFILSLGPVLHLGRQTIHNPFIIPLPYAVFYYIIPGFQGFRASVRWNMLFIVGLAIVIAIVLQKLLIKQSAWVRATVYVLLAVGIIAEYSFPMTLHAVPQKREFPPVYSWLAKTPDDAVIIEMPIYIWSMHPYAEKEHLREYYSTIHFRRTVNGATGFTPKPWADMSIQLLENFPSKQTIQALQKQGVRYVIIHTDEYDALKKGTLRLNKPMKSGEEILTEIRQYPQLKQVKTFKDTYVFELYAVPSFQEER